jgi:hypothetical protein
MKHCKIRKNNLEEVMIAKYCDLTSAVEDAPVSEPILTAIRKNRTATKKTLLKVIDWLAEYGLKIEYHEIKKSKNET